MLAFIARLGFIISVLSILISIFVTWIEKRKGYTVKLNKWIFISLFFALGSTLINEYANTKISNINDNKIESLNRSINNLKDSTDTIISEQKASIDSAELEILTLKNKLKPRTLKQEQRSALSNILKTGPKYPLTISCVTSDSGSERYALEFKDVFKKCFWDVSFVRPLDWKKIPVGIKLQYFSKIQDESPPEAFNRIGLALINQNIKFDAEIIENSKEVKLELVIGIKP